VGGGETARNVCSKPFRKRIFERPRIRWEESVELDDSEICRE
jgi:hypothetical protein